MKIKSTYYEQEIDVKNCNGANIVINVSARGELVCVCNSEYRTAPRIGEPKPYKVMEYDVNDAHIVSVEKTTRFRDGKPVVSFLVITSTDRRYDLQDVEVTYAENGEAVVLADTVTIL